MEVEYSTDSDIDDVCAVDEQEQQCQVDEDNHGGLRNLVKVKGKSLRKTSKSAINKFSAYLSYENNLHPQTHLYRAYIPPTVDAENCIPDTYFTKDLFGRFADYMISIQPRLAYNTIESYLSKVKNIISEDYEYSKRVRYLTNGKPAWYTRLVQKVRSTCNDVCLEEGTRLQDSAPAMTEGDLELLCKILFMKEANESFADRCLLIFQWQLMGRISEICNLTFDDIVFFKTPVLRCMKMCVRRSKTTDEQELLVFLHRNWLMCPLHAFACMLITNSTGNGRVFPHGSAKYVNDLLKCMTKEANEDTVGRIALHEISDGLVYKVTEGMTSRSLRSGPCTSASHHPGIDVTYVVPRGNWTMERIHTVFSEKLGEWEEAIKSWYINRNGTYLPFDQMEKDQTVSVSTIQEYITADMSATQDNHRLLVCVAENVKRLEYKIDSAQTKIDEVSSKVIEVAADVQILKSGHLDASARQEEKRSGTMRDFVDINPTEIPVSYSKFPEDLKTARKLDASALFFRWHNGEMHKIETDPGTKEREMLSKYGKLVKMMYKYLDPDDVIESKPECVANPTSEQLHAYKMWTKKMWLLASKVTKKAVVACDRSRGNNKRRRIEQSVGGLYDRLADLHRDQN